MEIKILKIRDHDLIAINNIDSRSYVYPIIRKNNKIIVKIRDIAYVVDNETNALLPYTETLTEVN